MDLDSVNEQTKLLVDNGHRVFQIHRFAQNDESHVKKQRYFVYLRYGASFWK